MTTGPEFDALKVEFSERTKPLVFWTGAGLSAPQIPSWSGLRDELLRVGKQLAQGLRSSDQATYIAELSAIKNSTDLWVQFERLENRLGREPYERTIKEALGLSEKNAIPPAQQFLWKLAPAGVVTLNLDLFTQRASDSHPAKSLPIVLSPGRFGDGLNVLKEKRPFIAYPHGHLDNPSLWTFTKAELDARLSDPRYVDWLTILFRASTVVFVGITADDVAIGSPLHRIGGGANKMSLAGHYWITARDDLDALSWASNNGVRIVRYENKSGTHSELVTLLSALTVPVKTEDAAKEAPVVSRSVTSNVVELPEPSALTQEPEETIRRLLNARATEILREPDETIRNAEYQSFLETYGRSIHRAWYASTIPGEAEFLGYNLVEEVAGGAFGTVYKGYAPDGTAVAVKILKSDNFRKPGFHRSFRRGANSLRILSERSIPGVIEYVDAAEIPPTIVMEWSEGSSLSELVEAGRFDDWPERIKVALALAHIIKTCHGLPERVLHRDLRPANVMIEDPYAHLDDWKVKVLDFDLSWHKGAEDHSIMHSPAFGYLAPEQRVKGPYITRNSLVDSYGLGMTLYFMCTKRNPFPDQHMHVNWTPELFRQFESKMCKEWKSLPRRFARLIYNSTLHEQPARATLAQMEGELESLSMALLTGGRVPLVDVITEEFASRTAHLDGYVWDEMTSSATLSTATGLNLGLSSVTGSRTIRFFASWADSGAADWNHIDRMLIQAVPKMQEALEKIGTDFKLQKGRRTFSITTDFEADVVRVDPTRFGVALDKAIEHASAIASF